MASSDRCHSVGLPASFRFQDAAAVQVTGLLKGRISASGRLQLQSCHNWYEAARKRGALGTTTIAEAFAAAVDGEVRK